MALQKLYFSGVASRKEFQLLQQAGVKRIMVDPFNIQQYRETFMAGSVDHRRGQLRR